MKFKTIETLIGIIFFIVLLFLSVKAITDWLTPDDTEKDYTIERLQKQIRHANIKYLNLAMENDSIRDVNDSLVMSFNEINRQKAYYLSLYNKYKHQKDTIIQIDSVFSAADGVIRLQEQQITQLQSINTNNETIITNLKAQVKDQEWLIKSCDNLLDISKKRMEKTEAKLTKVKNKRNIWIAIGVTEAVVIGGIILLLSR